MTRIHLRHRKPRGCYIKFDGFREVYDIVKGQRLWSADRLDIWTQCSMLCRGIGDKRSCTDTETGLNFRRLFGRAVIPCVAVGSAARPRSRLKFNSVSVSAQLRSLAAVGYSDTVANA